MIDEENTSDAKLSSDINSTSSSMEGLNSFVIEEQEKVEFEDQKPEELDEREMDSTSFMKGVFPQKNLEHGWSEIKSIVSEVSEYYKERSIEGWNVMKNKSSEMMDKSRETGGVMYSRAQEDSKIMAQKTVEGWNSLVQSTSSAMKSSKEAMAPTLQKTQESVNNAYNYSSTEMKKVYNNSISPSVSYVSIFFHFIPA